MYHADKDIRIANKRCAAIVIKNGSVLLMHRRKNNYEYYVFPGGHPRKGESDEGAAMRETYEETAIQVTCSELCLSSTGFRNGKVDHYFVCEWQKGGKPHLNGEEKVRNSQENFYDPVWMDIRKVTSLNLLPRWAKEWFVENLL